MLRKKLIFLISDIYREEWKIFICNIINATKAEEKIIENIINYIQVKYSDKLIVEKLKEIEIVDKLSGDASGRTVREKIFLSRQNGLDVLENKSYQKSNMFSNIDVKKLISIIYHELWHVNTWDKYEDMYEYVLDENNDCLLYTSDAADD